MLQVIAAALVFLLSHTAAFAQTAPDRPAAGVNRETGLPGSAGPKDRGITQHGAQPNAGEVRPGTPQGDAPSASAGELREQRVYRIFGLPVTAALLIGGVLVGLVALAAIVVPARRRTVARGNRR